MLFDDNHGGKVCVEAYERTTFFENKTRWENNFHKSYGKKIAKLLFISIFQQGKITCTRFLKLNETTVTCINPQHGVLHSKMSLDKC